MSIRQHASRMLGTILSVLPSGVRSAIDAAYIRLAASRSQTAAWPLVSVVISHSGDGQVKHAANPTVTNSAQEGLLRSVQSVLNQSYQRVECIVVLADLADHERITRAFESIPDSRLRLVHPKPDEGKGGASLARSYMGGVEASSGSLVTFLQSGDSLDRHSIWRSVRALHRVHQSAGEQVTAVAGVCAHRVHSSSGSLRPSQGSRATVRMYDLAAMPPDEAFRRVHGYASALLNTELVRQWGLRADDIDGEQVWCVQYLVLRLLNHGLVLIEADHAWLEHELSHRAHDIPGLQSRVTTLCARERHRQAVPKIGVLFMPHNAYHTREMASIAHELEQRNIRCLFVDITNAYPDEGSGRVMRKLGLDHVPYTEDILRRLKPTVLFVMNDWSPVVHDRVVECRSLGVRTIALVEGVQDFEDTHIEHLGIGQPRHAYRHVDVTLLVGEHDRKFFATQREGESASPEVRLTGSTRIERLAREPRPQNRLRRVLINSNFTYGIYTQIQSEWIESAVRACQRAGVDYVISQHHADTMDLSKYHRSTRPLYDELRECAVIVSKFSGVILEAMALDTPVIYHNPHGERIDKFLNPQGAYPVTHDVQSLADAISKIMLTPLSIISERQRAFFAHHVSIDAQRSCPQRIADVIDEQIAQQVHSD
jgi:hypothetical protein